MALHQSRRIRDAYRDTFCESDAQRLTFHRGINDRRDLGQGRQHACERLERPFVQVVEIKPTVGELRAQVFRSGHDRVELTIDARFDEIEDCGGPCAEQREGVLGRAG